jgi:cytoskeletal protein CcmA (bactofilin family)
MWKKTDDPPTAPAYSPPPQPAPPRHPSSEVRRGATATIGPSIRVKGDLSGDEDLLVEGQFDGKIELRQHGVTVGKEGRVRADIYGRTISVEGDVEGNLFADEQIVVRQSGRVLGNLTAPRVSLEDGAKFKGSIDMEPKSAKGAASPPASPRPAVEKAAAERPGAEAAGALS